MKCTNQRLKYAIFHQLNLYLIRLKLKFQNDNTRYELESDLFKNLRILFSKIVN